MDFVKIFVRDDPSGNYDSRKDFRDHCRLGLPECPLDLSYWAYLPSLPANAIFTALFGLSLLLFIVQGALSKRFLGFTIAMVSGCILEVLGYIGRLMSRSNPFNEVRENNEVVMEDMN